MEDRAVFEATLRSLVRAGKRLKNRVALLIAVQRAFDIPDTIYFDFYRENNLSELLEGIKYIERENFDGRAVGQVLSELFSAGKIDFLHFTLDGGDPVFEIHPKIREGEGGKERYLSQGERAEIIWDIIQKFQGLGQARPKYLHLLFDEKRRYLPRSLELVKSILEAEEDPFSFHYYAIYMRW